ncbi:MAG: flavodoxin family protein [Desulfovibrio sp.]|jgi:multimeric flavodoxin WrbA|nr:flavodoxin family protein [Desulfovibrio sp.]
MSAKLILGISGSSRKGANTDFLMAQAMAAAAEIKGIQTELIHLRDYTIAPCNSCFACCNEPAAGGDIPCISFRDGMDEIYPKLKACAGLIIGSPVFFGNLTAQVKAFMDRTEGLLRYGTSSYQYALRGKIGAGIAMGGNRHGGQEFTIQAIHYYYFVHDMMVVGTGPDFTPGCYLGGAGTNYPQRGKVRDAAKVDDLGIKASRMIGRRVAEAVLGQK